MGQATSNKMRKNISFVSAVIVFSLVGAGYVMGGRTPEMRSPIRVTDGYALSDGGSTWIELTDAQGKRFAIGVSGSLHQRPEDFPVRIQRWWPVLPVPVRVSPGSDNGRALLEVVERAGRDGGVLAAQQLAPVRIALARPSRT